MLRDNFYFQTGFAVFLIQLVVGSNSAMAAAQLDCMVKPEMYVELSSPVPGVLEKVFVSKGDHVSRGQVLAQLESSVETAKVKQLKFEAANNSEIENKKAQLQYAIRNRNRSETLFDKGSLSRGEKDKAETDVTLAETELALAIEQKKSAALMLEVANTQLALKTIKSPLDGIVIDRYAMIGETVENRAIMKLAQINPLRVELVAPTEYFGLIQNDMVVEIRPERPVGKSFQATVSVVDQLIDPASGSFSVRMALPNPDDKLIGGVNCIAIFGFDPPSLNNTGISSINTMEKQPQDTEKKAIGLK